MSGKLKQRSTSNSTNSSIVSVNEKILKECHSLYMEGDKGLVTTANDLDLSLLAPRKKITVLLIGNHSAGKSSFINWYIEEHVQRTGVAIETQGFTFVTSGRKRESLTGNATLHLYPHFEPLRKTEGVTDYLTTEISTSKQKKFSLVTFVDTPGLVDGDMKYPFDVNQAILWLGDLADLIFVFFDPIGQALCKRTLNVVESLSVNHADRMRFYLSKADEAGHESDRQRVMMQIVQELCKRPGLNRTGFDMPTIYVPSPNAKTSRCANQIEEVCKDIEKTINQTIQNTLNALEKDCDKVVKLIDDRLEQDRLNTSYNFAARSKGVIFTLLGVLLPVLLFVNFLASNASEQILQSVLGNGTSDALKLYMAPVRAFWENIPSDYHWHTLGFCAFLSLIFIILAKVMSRLRPTLTRKQKRSYSDKRAYVHDVIKPKKQQLYSEYLKQSVADHDL
ncbi:sarcalumenin-like [Watersipora subatra]|uniref:sarcalumenin-like n=1 Tax=Watersipora subatra TaxID=2589382 RepID=UPI00355AE1EF